MEVTTDHKPREIIEGYALTEKERAEFDYLDWPKIDAGEDSASFVRYRSQLYNLGECMRFTSPVEGGWQGYWEESYSTAVVARYVQKDGDTFVIIGHATG